MDVVPILDSYTEQAQPKLMQQYKDALNFNLLLQGECRQGDAEELALLSIGATRSLANAAGPQLDNIGNLFTEGRKGRTDADYRSAIYDKISVRTFATISSICEVVKAIYGATYAHICQEYPAGFVISTDATVTTAQIQALSGAGIDARSGTYLKTMTSEYLTTSLGERLIVTE